MGVVCTRTDPDELTTSAEVEGCSGVLGDVTATAETEPRRRKPNDAWRGSDGGVECGRRAARRAARRVVDLSAVAPEGISGDSPRVVDTAPRCAENSAHRIGVDGFGDLPFPVSAPSKDVRS